MHPSIIIPLIQYGIPAGLEGIKFLTELFDKLNNDPNMTQEQFNAEWAAMRKRYIAAGKAWDDAGLKLAQTHLLAQPKLA